MSWPARIAATAAHSRAPTVNYEDAIEIARRQRACASRGRAISASRSSTRRSPTIAHGRVRQRWSTAGSLTLDARPIAFAGSDTRVGQARRRRHLGAPPRRVLARAGRRARSRVCVPGFDAPRRRSRCRSSAPCCGTLAIEDAMADLFDTVDVLATPMAAIPAFAAEGPMPTRDQRAGGCTPGCRCRSRCSPTSGDRPPISVPAGVTAVGAPGRACTSWPTGTAKTCASASRASSSRRGRGRWEPTRC